MTKDASKAPDLANFDAKLAASCAPKGVEPPRVINSESLFAGAKLLVIDHVGEHYRLMITKNGKLILQK